MVIKFEKYHGTGNDFIMIDGRGSDFHIPETSLIAGLCDRRFGIGADGLIIIQHSRKHDFTMMYFNSDGQEGTLCGNGARCAVAYCQKLGMISRSAQFEAADGLHKATFRDSGTIHLEMNDVSDIRTFPDHFELDTGSPHYVQFVDDVHDLNVGQLGPKIRYNPRYKENGINVNFVSGSPDGLFVRTYERGVEAETYSCGTGVVASVLCATYKFNSDKKSFPVRTLGGNLEVSFERNKRSGFRNIVLSGPATFVFSGKVEI